ncbi:S-adenosyl-l-methionine hydroxide adenosyltransferase family protein [Chloroflexota bacterium]
MSRPVITLTTDFGRSDSYVGTMKGVILGICPEAALVDLSHEIQPQAVRQAAYLLSTAAPYFPPGTVHLAVVDPGVGGARRPVAVQTERATYVAPDNGLLSMPLAADDAQLAPSRVQAIHLTESRYHLSGISATFHGRDIFAPAAAHLAAGVDPRQMGDTLRLSDLVQLALRKPVQQQDGSRLGEVLHVDHFGNLVTSFRGSETQAQCSVGVADQVIAGLSRTFSDVEPGELVAYVGSSGHLEIAEREGRAAARLGVGVGAPVRLWAAAP